MVCRTLDEVYAAAAQDAIGDPPLTQEQVDLCASILAASQRAREPQAA